MIIEGLVTTQDSAGRLNVAPMGPIIEADFRRLILKPFRTSTTYRNLKEHGEGVFHVTDDVLLLARSTIGIVSDIATRAAESVCGRVLLDCCRYYEFRVERLDDSGNRVTLVVETVRRGSVRDFCGFNRARHAVIEVAILASRIDFLPADGIAEDLDRHRVVVEKTGDVAETEAFQRLESHIRAIALRRGIEIRCV